MTEAEWIRLIAKYFPYWENRHQPCAAMRVTGFMRPRTPVLVFENIVYCPRTYTIDRGFYAFGPGIGLGGYQGGGTTLVARDKLVEDLGKRTIRFRTSGVVFHSPRRDVTEAFAPKSGIAKTFDVEVFGHKLTVDLALPPMHGIRLKNEKLLKRLHPNEVVLFQIVDKLDRDILFRTPAEKGVPSDTKVLFQFDTWEHPRVDQPPEGSDEWVEFYRGLWQRVESSPDLVAMIRAVSQNQPLTHLPGKPNGDWRLWIDRFIDDRSAEDEKAWGEGAPVWEDHKPSRRRSRTAR